MADKKGAAAPTDVPAEMTLLPVVPGDVEALLEMGGAVLVSAPVERADGAQIYFVGKELQHVVVPALDPKLADFVTASEAFIVPDSFIDYIAKFKSKSAIARASIGQHAIDAVLDYHGDARMGDRDTAVPGRGAHTVRLDCPWDPDYQKWLKVFDEALEQEQMLEFLEDVIHTIADPVAGDLLDAIGNVELDREAKFKSVRNLRNGTVQFVYAEDERSGSAIIPMPEVIKVVTPIFQGGMALQLDVKLRYRLLKGMLVFTLVLPGREKLEREGFRVIAERVRQDTGTPVFYGA